MGTPAPSLGAVGGTWPSPASRSASGPAADTAALWHVLHSSRFEVTAGAGGFLSVFAHRHEVAAGAFRAFLRYDPDAPRSDSVAVVVPVDSLRVRTADASPAQLHAIRQHMMEDVLHPDRHPTIRFESRSVTSAPGGIRIEGDLTLADSTRAVRVDVHLEIRGDTLVARGTLPFQQTNYGIEPYSFGFGAIKVEDRVKLSFDVRAVREGS